MARRPMPATGDVYRHYKGDLYRVIFIAFATEELMRPGSDLIDPDARYVVIYEHVPGGTRWVRPLYGEGGWSTPVRPGQSRFERCEGPVDA